MKREHLTAARQGLKLTALQLAERTGIKEEKIYQVERGRYLPTRLEALSWACALGMAPGRAFPEFFAGGIQ